MRKVYSILIIFFSLLAVSGFVSGQEYDYPSFVNGAYAEEKVEFTVDKTGGTDGSLTANVCGQIADAAETSGGTGQGGVATVEYPVTMSFDIPQDAPCSTGNHEITLKRSSIDGTTVGEEIGTLDLQVEPKNMDANVGRNILVSMDITGDSFILKNFILTNDVWQVDGWNSGGVETGNIFVQYFDNDLIGNSHQYGQWELRPGQSPRMFNTEGMDTFINSQEKVGFSNVQEKARDVTTTWFSQENTFEYGVIEDVWNIGSQSPLHDDGSWYLDGQVILGYYPQHYLNSGTQDGPPNQFTQDDRLFFVCREGADMPVDTTEDFSTSQVVNADSDGQSLYKCNQDTGEWESVNECEDGLDNDGDGYIDGSNDYNGIGTDPSCETGTSESGSSGCSTPKVYEKTTYDPNLDANIGTGEYYAEYESGGECVTEDYTEWNYVNSNGEPGTPVTDTCQPDDTGPNCDSISDYDGYSTYDTAFNTYIGDMPVVKYGAHTEYFEQLAEARGVDIREGEDGVRTDFVETNTGWTTQTQSLYTAERKYDADQNEEMRPSNCNLCQDYSWWNNRNMTNLDGYQETTTGNHIQAWKPYNAGANVSGEIDSSYGSPFQGGFAGDCSDTTTVGWADQTEDPDLSNQLWECVGETEIDSPLSGSSSSVTKVPGVTASVLLPDTDINQGSREIGLVLMPYLHQDTRPNYLPNELNTYHEKMQGTALEGDDVESMDVECWAGSIADQPDDVGGSDSGFYREGVPVSSTEPYGVSGEVQADDVSNYACVWQYSTAQRGNPMIGSGVVELHKNNEQGDDYKGFWDDLQSAHNGLKEEMTASELQSLVG